jgi:DNA-binding NarL/FixJ family response regulator
MGQLCRVALADDVPEIRMMLRFMLELDGRFEIVGEANNGAQAVDIASATRPDVMILDLGMPVMDGFAAIPKICRLSPQTKILVLSAFESGGSESVLSLGAHDYLIKGTAVHEDVIPRVLSLLN